MGLPQNPLLLIIVVLMFGLVIMFFIAQLETSEGVRGSVDIPV